MANQNGPRAKWPIDTGGKKPVSLTMKNRGGCAIEVQFYHWIHCLFRITSPP